MLHHTDARGRSNNRSHGRNVYGADHVATGANYVESIRTGIKQHRFFEHHINQPGEFINGFTLAAQSHHERANFCLRRFAIHDL